MIYILLFFVFFIFSIKYDYYGHKKNRSYAYWFSVLLLIFVAGFRYHVGLDSIRLSEWYKSCPSIFNLNYAFIDGKSEYQPLWIILCSFLKTITSEFALLQIVQSALVNILIFNFVKKKTPYIFSSLLIYFILAYVVFNFEIMRESLAIAIVLWAVLNYEKKKWVKSIFIFLIAYEIHVSVIIMLLFPIVYNIDIKKYHIFIALLLIMSINIFYGKYIDILFEILSKNNDNVSKRIIMYTYAGEIGNSVKYYISIYLIGFIIPMLFLFIRNTQYQDKFKYSSLIVLYSIFSLIGNQSVAFLRFSNYQLIFYVILTAEIYQYFLKKFSAKFLIGFIFCILLSFPFIYSMTKPVPLINGCMTYRRYYPYYSIFYTEKDYYRELWSKYEFE